MHQASLTQLGLDGGRFAHDVWTSFLHHICPFVQPLLFSPNQLKKEWKKHLAPLHRDEVKQSHLRASDPSWELKVSREICPQGQLLLSSPGGRRGKGISRSDSRLEDYLGMVVLIKSTGSHHQFLCKPGCSNTWEKVVEEIS